jgi:hypothetical protein
MPWNCTLFDSTGKVKDARTNPAPTAVEADWTARTSQPGVVWYHDFRNQAEIDQFRWTGTYGSGNDPTGAGQLSIDGSINSMFRQTADGITGGACLELQQLFPLGGDNSCNWQRIFSPLDSASTGRGEADPADSGRIPVKSYTPTDQGNQYSTWNDGHYGHPTYHNSNFDGHGYYLQLRVKMDPNRTAPGNGTQDKLLYVTASPGGNSLTSQEIVTYSGGQYGTQSIGMQNNHRMYVAGSPPIESVSKHPPPGYHDGQQFGSEVGLPGCNIATRQGNCWAYSFGWDTLLYRIIPGTNAGSDARIIVYAANPGDTNYTRIWDLRYSMTFESNQPFGHNAIIPSVYMDPEPAVTWRARFDQIIFSKDFIPLPRDGLGRTALGQAAYELSPGESVDFTVNTVQNPRDIQWALETIYHDPARRELQYLGMPASSQGGIYKGYKYDEETDQWSLTFDSGLDVGHAWNTTFDFDRGDYYFRRHNRNEFYRFKRDTNTFAQMANAATDTGIVNGLQNANHATSGAVQYHPNLFGNGHPGILVLHAFRFFWYDIEQDRWTYNDEIYGNNLYWQRWNGTSVYLADRDEAVIFAEKNDGPENNAIVVKAGAATQSTPVTSGYIVARANNPVRIEGVGLGERHGVVTLHPRDRDRILILEQNGTAQVWESTDGAASWSLRNGWSHPFDNLPTLDPGEWTIGNIPMYGVIIGMSSNESGGGTRLWSPPD